MNADAQSTDASLSMREPLSHASIQEMLRRVVEKQAADDTTAIGKVFSEAGRAYAQDALPSDKGEVLKISFSLDATQQNILRANFPGRRIVFSNSSSSSHCFAAAHRLLETDFVYRCFGNTVDSIIDLGGNFVSHMKVKRHNVHCCCPILDARDGARLTERILSLKSYVRKHPEIVGEADYCMDTFQKCSRRADYAFAIHSTSDLDVGELACSLDQKGVMKFICTMMVDADMLIHNEGEIPNFNVRWEIDHKNDLIHFDFIDEPNLGYSHRFSLLKHYLTYNAVDLGHAAYRIERKQDFGGVMVIDLTYSLGFVPKMPHSNGRSCAWYNRVKGQMVVHTVNEGYYHHSYQTAVRRKVLVDKKVLTRVTEVAFRQFRPNADAHSAIQSIATMLSSSTNHTIIGGVTLISGKPLSPDDYIPVATTIYYRVKKLYNAIPEMLSLLDKGERLSTDAVLKGSEGPTWYSGPTFLSALDKVNVPGDFVAKALLSLPKRDLKSLFSRSATSHSERTPVQDESPVRCTDGVFYPIRMLLKCLGSDKFESVTITDPRSNTETTVDLYQSFQKKIETVFSFILGKIDGPSPLISDPVYFQSLEDVYYAEWHQGNAIDASNYARTLLDDIRKQKEESLKAKAKEVEDAQKLNRAILQVHAYLEAHPDGRKIEGLGLSSQFIAKIPELAIPTPKPLPEFEKNAETGEILRINPHSDAILEAIDYLKSTSANSIITLNKLGDHCQWTTKGLDVVWAGDDKRRAFIPKKNTWVGPTARSYPLAKYERAMSKDGYVTLRWDGEVLDANCVRSLSQYEIVFVDQSCVFASAERIIPSLEKALGLEAHFSVTIVDGVAGCGKTTNIKQIARSSGQDVDLILTSNRSSADELKETIDCSPLTKLHYIRTCDSYLMSASAVKAQRLIFDECFLQHAGLVYAAATLAGCSEVIGFGDTEQIPFVSRNPSFVFRHHKLTGKVERKLITWRSPADATYCLEKYFYKNKKPVKTNSRVLRSIEVVPINSPVSVERNTNALYLCHTQAEKAVLKAQTHLKGCDNIFTTHEAQGKTFDNVYFCRLTRTSTSLTTGRDPINGPCHGLVALSRHKKTFKYFTIAHDSDDVIYNACRDAGNTDDSILARSYNTNF
uniref:Replication protein 1a n=11 Tax=Alfalfa mosaic virus TaxID=12321 RepID=A0A346KIA0_AMV|nr:replicase [Alfalfa mosaic virus]QEQ43442.1 replicase [Alfalfa mosaic virus]UJQ84809.1 MAG: P1 protein [Alfalfa mosaic virus]UZP16987.1 hypothetical protein [Alfalfa mosaic virus]